MIAIIKRSFDVQAADVLRQQILSAAIPAGSRLTEVRLAGELGLSRATVRTALHQLVNEGLVVQVPYTGWEVATLTAHDAWELFTLRSSLEALAAGLAAQRAGTLDLDALDRAFEDLQTVCRRRNRAAIADADFALHEAIVKLAGHGRLRAQYRIVEQQIRMCIASSNALIGGGQSIIDEHRPMVEAIRAGDAESAARFARDHNAEASDLLVTHLKRLEEQTAD